MGQTAITLDENEMLTCIIHPADGFPNDAMTCVSDQRDKRTVYIRKHNSLLIEAPKNIEIAVIEQDRKNGITRFTMKNKV